MLVREKYCIKRYYKVIKIAMSLIGQWPYQSQGLAKILILVWFFQHLSILLPEVIKFIEIRNNIDYVIEAFCPVLYNCAVAIKYANGLYNKKKINTIIDRIQKDWDSIGDKKEIEILSKYANFGRLMSVGYFYMCLATLIIYLCLPFTPFVLDIMQPLNKSRPKAPLYLVEFFVDEKKYFFHILAHSYVTTIIGFVPIIATDTFYASTVQHACGMLAVLGHRLKKINKRDKLDKKLSNDSYQQIVACAAQHNEIIQFYENINGAYSDSFFFIMGMNMVIMSFSGVLTILKWGRVHDMIRTGMFLAAQSFHLFYYSYQGQNLLDQSLLISDCLYDSNWYTASHRTQKIVAIMIMRSIKPFHLTAKVFIMSLPHFTMVLKTSMSYFTVLKSSR